MPFLKWWLVFPRDFPYSTSSNLYTTPSWGRLYSFALSKHYSITSSISISEYPILALGTTSNPNSSASISENVNESFSFAPSTTAQASQDSLLSLTTDVSRLDNVPAAKLRLFLYSPFLLTSAKSSDLINAFTWKVSQHRRDY